MTQNIKQKITKTLSITALILILVTGAYTYPKPQPTVVEAKQPTLEELKAINDKQLEEAKKALENQELEKQILELKEKQEGLKVQR